MESAKTVDIYIKTRFSGNPHGYGEAVALIEFIKANGKVHLTATKLIQKNTTLNRLNLSIYIQAMKRLKEVCKVNIHNADEYTKCTIEKEWLKQWKSKDWLKANGEPPANVEEWKELQILLEIHRVTFDSQNNKYKAELATILQKELPQQQCSIANHPCTNCGYCKEQ